MSRFRPTRPPTVSARAYLVHLLARREYTAQVLLERLALRGYLPEDAQAALEECQRLGLQSDSRAAASRVRQDGRRMGNRRLVAKLTQVGIAREAATAQLDSLEDELTRALALARRRSADLSTQAGRARLWRFLTGRGFPPGVCAQVLKTLYASSTDEDTHSA